MWRTEAKFAGSPQQLKQSFVVIELQQENTFLKKGRGSFVIVKDSELEGFEILVFFVSEPKFWLNSLLSRFWKRILVEWWLTIQSIHFRFQLLAFNICNVAGCITLTFGKTIYFTHLCYFFFLFLWLLRIVLDNSGISQTFCNIVSKFNKFW